jgi:DNA topoisomerase-3
MSPCGVLCVAEKPSLAASIAQFLSDGACKTRLSAQDVHEHLGTFRGQPAAFKVTSVIGHVYTTDFHDAYQDWDMDPSKLFDAPTVRKESNPRARICEHLRQVSVRVRRLYRRYCC